MLSSWIHFEYVFSQMPIYMYRACLAFVIYGQLFLNLYLHGVCACTYIFEFDDPKSLENMSASIDVTPVNIVKPYSKHNFVLTCSK